MVCLPSIREVSQRLHVFDVRYALVMYGVAHRGLLVEATFESGAVIGYQGAITADMTCFHPHPFLYIYAICVHL